MADVTVSQFDAELVFEPVENIIVSQFGAERVSVELADEYLIVSQLDAELAYSPPVPQESVKGGGFDIRFSLSGFDNGDSIAIKSNIDFSTNENDAGSLIEIARTGTNTIWARIIRLPNMEIVEERRISAVAYDGREIRVFMHEEFCSIYLSEVWKHTFAIANIEYNGVVSLSFTNTGDTSVTVDRVELPELFAWRESIYVEMESTGKSALSSVIQERPVEMIGEIDGALAFTYNFTRDEFAIDGDMVRQHDISEQEVEAAGSDHLVYYTEVAAIINGEYAISDGFRTRILRLFNLDNDALSVAQMISNRVKESMMLNKTISRFDVRVEQGDILSIEYTISATGTVYSEQFIVESIKVSLGDGKQQMIVSGRERIY
ncbi:MAG: hypothetical protein U9N61_11985 [Euryarchaeota archaeon]|nr:hypothetical protein [Euryarchaeota archaeon]